MFLVYQWRTKQHVNFIIHESFTYRLYSDKNNKGTKVCFLLFIFFPSFIYNFNGEKRIIKLLADKFVYN